MGRTLPVVLVGQHRIAGTTGRRRLVIASVLLGAIAIAACSNAAARQGDLDRSKAMWESRGQSNYTITYERRCFCGFAGSFVARVDNGAVTSVEPATGIGGTEEMPIALTVERLFEVVQEAIDRGADRIEVEYDTEYGYPRRIFVDGDRGAEDDELTITAELAMG